MAASQEGRQMSVQARPRLDRGVLVLTAIFLVAFPLLFKPWVHGFDTVAYYSWLRSAVIDGDLDVGNEFEHFGYGSERGTTVTGHTYSEWAVGSAILWAPFFLGTHAISLLGQALGFAVDADGYAPQYVLAVSLGSALFALTAIVLTYLLCREFFSVRTSVLATAAAWLSSPLVFYMYSHPVMSHANDAFAYTLFIFTWYKTRNQTTWSGAMLRGATAGLCALVRQANAVLVFFVLGEYAIDSLRLWCDTRQPAAMTRALGRMLLFSGAWWLVYSPQVITWRVALGRWIVPNPYAAGVGVGFAWWNPRIFQVLFSTNRGLFVWTPLMLPAVAGWFLLRRKAPRLSLLLLVNFLAQLYVVASWGAWSGSAAFGQRFFTNMLPSFALGLAALLAAIRTCLGWRWTVGLCTSFIVWNGLLVVRYVLEDVPRAGPVPLRDLVFGQFTVLPRYLGRIVQILLTRS